MKILITGTAGFIGYHLAERLIKIGHDVIGLDSINDYYSENLKYARLAEAGVEKEKIQYGKFIESKLYPNYKFIQLDLNDKFALQKLFQTHTFQRVCNLAAQAGVRHSISHPDTYVESNIVGFLNILEMCRHYDVEALAYASSSSVYGLNTQQPFSTSDSTEHPISLYAATKKSNELMAHSYSSLYGLPTTGLRFFTVYGPWGRPDMALMLFAKAMLEGKTINVFNNGNMERDFTYIDDIVDGLICVLNSKPETTPDWNTTCPNPEISSAPYRIYNIGSSRPSSLIDFIGILETELGVEALKMMHPMQVGDVRSTFADISRMNADFGYSPKINLQEGVKRFVEWYKRVNIDGL